MHFVKSFQVNHIECRFFLKLKVGASSGSEVLFKDNLEGVMSLYGTMRTGVSGMNAQANRLSTVADNIANSSTIGYKKASTQFSSMILPSSNGSYNSGGVNTTVRYSINDQGSFTYTTSTTDLAINGEGFFIVQGADGSEYLTRAGNFEVQPDGTLMNAAGYTLMGYPYSSEEDPTIVINGFDGLSEINVSGAGLSAVGSTSGTLNANLPAGAEIGYSKTTSLVAYDSQGNTRLIEFEYTKVADNAWQVGATYNGSPLLQVPAQASTIAVVSGNVDASAPVGTTFQNQSVVYDSNGIARTLDIDYTMTTDGWEFTVSHAGTALYSDQLHANEFDAAGNYIDPETINLPPLDLGGGIMTGPIAISQVNLTSVAGPSTIAQNFNTGHPAGAGTWTMTFDANGQLVSPETLTTLPMALNGADLDSITIDISGSSQMAADFSVVSGKVNGSAASSVKSYEISKDGVVSLSYADGTLRQLYRIAMANVQSPNNLTPREGNVYSQSNDSGVIVMGYAGNSGYGSILSGALEDSNVDIAEELTSMIESQRNYTANSKVFQTGSELLETLVNLKR